MFFLPPSLFLLLSFILLILFTEKTNKQKNTHAHSVICLKLPKQTFCMNILDLQQFWNKTSSDVITKHEWVRHFVCYLIISYSFVIQYAIDLVGVSDLAMYMGLKPIVRPCLKWPIGKLMEREVKPGPQSSDRMEEGTGGMEDVNGGNLVNYNLHDDD